jgi:prephenate dehydrogenase (NADP+)
MKIGIVGLGDMGRLFAKSWAEKGHEVFAADLPHNYADCELFAKENHIKFYKKSSDFAKELDFLLISVEAKNLDKTCETLAPFIKESCIVSAQTSVKYPEFIAFKKHFKKAQALVGSHALFGPNVNLMGQTVVMYPYNSDHNSYITVQKCYDELGLQIQHLGSHEEHDKLMADIQVVTHIGFESLGTAFMHRKSFPWESEKVLTGIDHIKILLTLRIYSYKSHVYAGLAFYNPYAAKDVRTFASVQNKLFGFMISENRNKYESELRKSRDKFLKNSSGKRLLSDKIIEEFTENPEQTHLPNSHLSLMSMLCTWAELGTNPYENLICQTPPFRLRVGLVEYLCQNEDLFSESIHAAIYDKQRKVDDLAYHTAVHEWANILQLGDEAAYIKHFDQTKKFLSPRLAEGLTLSHKLIEKLY